MSDLQTLALLLAIASAAVPVAYYSGRERVLHRLREISTQDQVSAGKVFEVKEVEDGVVPDGQSVLYMVDGVVKGVFHVTAVRGR